MKERTVYTPEFQTEAVRLVLTQGLPISEAARRIDVPKGTLTGWVRRARNADLPVPPGSRPHREMEAEIVKLRKELAEARMERDILRVPFRVKKATALLAKGSLPGTR